MKKCLIPILMLLLVLTACASASDPIQLPEASELATIQLQNSLVPAQLRIMETEEERAAFIEAIESGSKKTRTESVNDQPTNVDAYYTIRFSFTEPAQGESVAYAYKKDGKAYVEQPYQGIWEIPVSVYDDQVDVSYD